MHSFYAIGRKKHTGRSWFRSKPREKKCKKVNLTILFASGWNRRLADPRSWSIQCQGRKPDKRHTVNKFIHVKCMDDFHIYDWKQVRFLINSRRKFLFTGWEYEIFLPKEKFETDLVPHSFQIYEKRIIFSIIFYWSSLLHTLEVNWNKFRRPTWVCTHCTVTGVSIVRTCTLKWSQNRYDKLK
jgi:hypothetical protein